MSLLGSHLAKALAELRRGKASHREWNLCCRYGWGVLTQIARLSTDAQEATVGTLLAVTSSDAFAANASAWDRDDGLPADRRHRTLRAMVRCLDTLLAARRRVINPDNADEVAEGLIATIAALGVTLPAGAVEVAEDGLQHAPTQPEDGAPGAELAALEAGYDAVAQHLHASAAASESAKFWTRCLLADPEQRLLVRILSVDQRDGSGSSSLLRVGGAGPGLAPLTHPEVALGPLADSFLDAVDTAWGVVGSELQRGSSLWWSVVGDEPVALSGTSAGGALAVAFGLALEGRVNDAATTVCAAIELDGTLGVISPPELSSKLIAAESQGVQRVVVARNQHLPSVPPGAVVVRADRWRDAAEVASRDAELVRGYLRGLTASLDLEMGKAPFLDDVTSADLYVEPEMLEEQAQGNDPHAQEEPPHDHLESQDLYGTRQAEFRRLSLTDLRDETGPYDTVVVKGMPGSGKSLFVRAEVASLASAQLELLESGTSLDRLILPVRVELTGLEIALSARSEPARAAFRRAIENGRGTLPSGPDAPGSVIDLDLRAAIGVSLEREVERECAVYLAERLGDANSHLYFDGHDEVGAPEILAAPLAALANWRTPVVVTSRPARDLGIWSGARGQQPYRSLDLAPFSRAQIETFVSRRFCADEELRERTLRHLAPPSPLAEMAESPFLLTLLCWLSKKNLISDEMTRTQVYDRVVEEMLGWRRADGGVDVARAKKLRRMLAEIVLRLFVEGLATQPLDGEYLADLIGRSDRRPDAGDTVAGGASVDEKAEAIIAELARKRVIVRVADGNERTPPQWMFPHLTIAEYLAGVEIADGLSAAVHVGSEPLWLPALQAHFG